MKTKITTCLAAVAALAASLGAFAETKEIPLLPGEYWWGGTVGGGYRMPLGEKSDYRKDLRVDSDGNQAAPLLLSTKGRWVWCEDAFKYTVKNGVLTVETGPAPRKGGNTPHPMDVFAAEAKSKGEEAEFKNEPAAAIPNLEKTCYSKKEFAPIQSGRAEGGTLRAAFEYCSKTFFPPQGTPDLDFFRHLETSMGGTGYPLTAEQVKDKFFSCVKFYRMLKDDAQIEKLYEASMNTASLKNVGELIGLL